MLYCEDMNNQVLSSQHIIVVPNRNGTPEEKRAYWRMQRARWRNNNRDRARASNRSWRLKNLDKARAQSRAACKRYLAKPEKKAAMLEYGRAYAKANYDPEYQRNWTKANPDKARAYVAKYDINNREARKLAARAYRKRHPHKVSATEQRWRDANRDALTIKEHIRKNIRGKFDIIKIKARVDLFGNLCAYCRGPFESLDIT